MRTKKGFGQKRKSLSNAKIRNRQSESKSFSSELAARPDQRRWEPPFLRNVTYVTLKRVCPALELRPTHQFV